MKPATQWAASLTTGAATGLAVAFATISGPQAYTNFAESLKSPEQQMTDQVLESFANHHIDATHVTRTKFDPASLSATFTAANNGNPYTIEAQCAFIPEDQREFGQTKNSINCIRNLPRVYINFSLDQFRAI